MADVQPVRIPEFRVAWQGHAPAGDAQRLVEFVRSHRRLLVVTGAGLSTGCGIPAYRDGDGRWTRRRPILYQEFLGDPAMRRRYWARSFFGWPAIRRAQPGTAHRALAALSGNGRLAALVTQNVDGLHRRAGTGSVIELHGNLARVACMQCDGRFRRQEVQTWLQGLNPGWSPEVLEMNPDGDAELDERSYPGFRIADCPDCGGILKPDVVFFGESVPAARVTAVREALAASEAVLVVGSSLVVFSGYRIVREGVAAGLPVVAVNRGRTRADDLLRFKVAGDCDQVLGALAGDWP